MRNYTTQMDAARKGIVTPEIEKVAEKEHMSTEALMKLVGEGKVAIPANKKHTCLNPEGVGSMLRAQDQCQSWRVKRLQGLWYRDAEGYECCRDGSRGDHGSVKPRQYTAVQTEAHFRVSGYDRNCAGI